MRRHTAFALPFGWPTQYYLFMKRKIFCRGLALCLLIIAIVCVFNAIAIWRYAQLDMARPADCAIVPGAGIQADAPSPVFQGRLDRAIALYHAGYVGKIILTGGVTPGTVLSDAAIASRYVTAAGIPATDILIEPRSRITRENLHNAHRLMEQHHLQSALIVSDPLHMKRAMRIAHDARINALPAPATDSRYRSLNTRLRFLARETFYYTSYLFFRPLLLPGDGKAAGN